MIAELVKRLQEQADKIDQVMKRHGVSFVECQLMRQAAKLIASQAEEIARERSARLAALDEALEALKLDTRKNRLISGGTVGPARFRDDARPQAA